LGAYVDQASATPEELFDDTLATNAGAVRERVAYDDGKFADILLLDRQIIGQDWIRPNFAPVNALTPVLTFFSCKGGVGRSTALAIVASDLSERGKNVLIVDLDLEAR
jgi:Mrp family chromosome partitioning ATPase